jgi:phosphoenolpyruvate-protein phosphotransferase (PTS system enzyme I)
MKEGIRSRMKTLPGIIGASGVAVGKAYLVDRSHFRFPRRAIDPIEVGIEIRRFEDAVKASTAQLREAMNKVNRRDHRIIIDSHIMLASDSVLGQEVADRIASERINAEWAVSRVLGEAKKALGETEEETLRERRTDIEHVTSRLLRNLIGIHRERLDSIREPAIVVAHDLSPADMAHIRREFVLGIVTDGGGRTSHTAIFAQGMNIPTILGTEVATSEIDSGVILVVDAINGKVIVEPTLEVLEEYEQRRSLFKEQQIELLQYKDLPSATNDGKPIVLSANIEIPEEVSGVRAAGINSVGLFRSEFLFLTAGRFPTEQEQFEAYKNVLQSMGPGNPVTIRTLDIGADKLLPDAFEDHEANPALGVRAIRFSFMRTDIFRAQLRALLRASVFGKLRIMFPMISGLDEVQKALHYLEQTKQDLQKEGVPFSEDIDVGIMIEVPSAALVADMLAQYVDFFSIGTNDLIQYMLAVDRTNEHVNYLYSPMHPAVLRVIDEVIKKGHEADIHVSMCGDMASEAHLTMLLVGLGIDELSMPASSALKVKRLIRSVGFEEAQEFAEHVLALGCSSDVKRFLKERMSRRFPDVFGKEYWEYVR